MFVASSRSPPGYPIVILSRLGPPFAVVAVGRIRFVPALGVAVKVAVAHVSQVPVLGNGGVATRTRSPWHPWDGWSSGGWSTAPGPLPLRQRRQAPRTPHKTRPH